MNKKLIAFVIAACASYNVATAQRFTDRLDRGLVAVQTTGGVYCSWRIQADEYHDVKYNLYRDGTKVNAEPLNVSNFTDASGSQGSTYTVKAVVNGVEQEASKAVSVLANNYKSITIKHDASLKSTYVPNDACCADVDGDGEVEILLKFDNKEEGEQLYPKNGPTINGVETKEYSMLACLKQDGTVLWWVNCGPNMGDFQNNEQNIVGYDWDMDGKAEVVMRLEEGSTVHMADGTTYTIGADGKNGTSWTNYRIPKGSGSVEWFTYYGKEFLYYCEGATGKPYQCIDYPLKRLEAGETDLKAAWGDGYGHRSSKHFFGAPYLDGKHPSMFIGRGIYTRHKFIAYDVDPATHALNVRWQWTNNKPGSPWYGQGYHNYSIADVDWDGRDEIVWGSMVIDDNGMGLSTTGLGHGDAHHVSDLNPYMHGQEIFACNEDNPANNFRDATTSKIYYRMVDTNDAGRALAGNFYNTIPGAIGYGAHDTPISTVTNDHVSVSTTGLGMNFRIYWDGDLQEESFDNITVSKPGVGTLTTFSGAYSNNSTKATPCYQGDIFGDWREEVIERTADNNIRIYTTTIPTEWRNYSLWYDHQYRNAMVWQPCGYNQPPHASYFLGELEGITIAPPPLTTTGREEVSSSIESSFNGKHALLSTTGDATVSVAEGASPAVFTDNAPSWVQGTAQSECTTKDTEITYDYYTHTLTGGAFTGAMRLVKQGDGTLVLPNVKETYTGSTDVWAGTLQFDGTMEKSPVWLNRFARLSSNGGKFLAGIKADYGSEILPGGKNKVGTIETSTLALNFGSAVEFDIDKDGNCDMVKANTLKIEKKEWTNGPEYNAPHFDIVLPETVSAGTYNIVEVENIEGDINDITITGMNGRKAELKYADGVLSLVIKDVRDASTIEWSGSEDNTWQLAEKSNFKSLEGNDDIFVSGDHVIFNDKASNGDVVLTGDVTPSLVTFENNTLEYTLSGANAITGNASITKNGSGNVNINNTNTFTGQVNVNAGTISVKALGQQDGTNNGALGHYSNVINLNGGTLAAKANMTSGHPMIIGSKNGTIMTDKGVSLTLADKITGTGNTLIKEGEGTLYLAPDASYGTLIVNGGTVVTQENSASKHGLPKDVVLNDGATLRDADNIYSYSANSANVSVTEGSNAKWYLDARCNYSGKLTGKGTLNLYVTSVRSYIKGDWSSFEGTINVYSNKTGSYDPTLFIDNSSGMGKATVNAVCPLDNNGKNVAIGNLLGTGTLSGSGTWTIGALNEDIKYTGEISGGKIIKTGSGTWTISKVTSGLKGITTVNGGVLNLNNTASTEKFFGNYETAVSGTGILAGRALLHGITVNSGGTLKPGNYTSNIPTGCLKSANSIYCYEGSTVKFFLYNNKGASTSRTYLDVASTLSVDGDIVVEAYSKYVPKIGDTFTLWTASTFKGVPTNITLPELPEGMAWDTSELLKPTGVIKIIESTAINGITVDGDFEAKVYTTNGILVGIITTNKDNLADDVRRIAAKGMYVVKVNNNVIKIAVN
ncbi:MAG: autotransporter-associated beta strand repeat-containing protein [Prevotella sp.]|nr:autotransporter-associated beta strand repeat-containing protein [Prevotella sp.]